MQCQMHEVDVFSERAHGVGDKSCWGSRSGGAELGMTSLCYGNGSCAGKYGNTCPLCRTWKAVEESQGRQGNKASLKVGCRRR